MKALSIRQPWAFCILHLGKRVENRSWKPGGFHLQQAAHISRGADKRIALHASGTMTHDDYAECLETLEDVIRVRPPQNGWSPPRREQLQLGGIVGTADLIGIVNDRDSGPFEDERMTEARRSPWYFGPYGLVLANATDCKFVPCKGALGFFDVPDEIAREALAA